MEVETNSMSAFSVKIKNNAQMPECCHATDVKDPPPPLHLHPRPPLHSFKETDAAAAVLAIDNVAPAAGATLSEP